MPATQCQSSMLPSAANTIVYAVLIQSLKRAAVGQGRATVPSDGTTIGSKLSFITEAQKLYRKLNTMDCEWDSNSRRYLEHPWAKIEPPSAATVLLHIIIRPELSYKALCPTTAPLVRSLTPDAQR